MSNQNFKEEATFYLHCRKNICHVENCEGRFNSIKQMQEFDRIAHKDLSDTLDKEIVFKFECNNKMANIIREIAFKMHDLNINPLPRVQIENKDLCKMELMYNKQNDLFKLFFLATKQYLKTN